MDMQGKSIDGEHGAARPDTVIRQSTAVTAGVYALFTLLGTGLGWLVGLLADWLLSLDHAPLQGPAEIADAVPGPLLLAAGAALGLVVGFIAQYEQLTVRVSDERVMLHRKGQQEEFPRESVGTVFRDGKRLVLLGRDGIELAREESDVEARRLADAFAAHGYAWAETDPHEGEYRRWVPGTPGLPEGANAVLKARQLRLEKEGSDHAEVRELRGELARLGVVVRDEKRRQYVRTRHA